MFFSSRKEQEVSLLSDAENLSALLQEAARQCEKPNTLPEAGEHMIEEFKISESGLLDEQVIVSHLMVLSDCNFNYWPSYCQIAYVSIPL